MADLLLNQGFSLDTPAQRGAFVSAIHKANPDGCWSRRIERCGVTAKGEWDEASPLRYVAEIYYLDGNAVLEIAHHPGYVTTFVDLRGRPPSQVLLNTITRK